MQLKRRLQKLEREPRKIATQHIWRNLGETEQDAVERASAMNPPGENALLVIYSWGDPEGNHAST